MYLKKSLARKIAKLNIDYRIKHNQNKCTICNKELLLENKKDFVLHSLLNSNDIIKEYLQTIDVTIYQVNYSTVTYDAVLFHSNNDYNDIIVSSGEGMRVPWLIDHHYFSSLTSESKKKSFLKYIFNQDYDRMYQETGFDYKTFYNKSFDFKNNIAIHGLEFDELAKIKNTNKTLNEILEVLKIKSSDIYIKCKKFDLIRNDNKIDHFQINKNKEYLPLETSLKLFVNDQLVLWYDPARINLVCNSCTAQTEWNKIRKHY